MTVTDKPAKAEKVTEASRFKYEGEYIDIEPSVGYQLIAEYRVAAAALASAKAEAFKIEEKIKELMRGHEILRINGDPLVTWKWGGETKFDKRGLQLEAPELVEKYTVRTADTKRTFNAKGVVGVD